MFNADFYPTPSEVIDQMLEGENIEGKVVLEPSGGKGDLVDRLIQSGASQVLACEIEPNLQQILKTKCNVIADDFLKLESDRVSHVDLIVMNPPFSDAVSHILHAYHIAPDGCRIVALCNIQTLKNSYSKSRQELSGIVSSYGSYVSLGECFSQAERRTDVEVALIRIQKPANGYEAEFEGFFMEEEVEESTGPGLMSYSAVRDLVNRYVESIKIYDQQLETAARLNEMQRGYFDKGEMELSVSITRGDIPVARNDFKKKMQKAGWAWIFEKMNLQKYATKGLKEDINKFVEQQSNVPFTMRNIYKMLEIVVATSGQRMDKAILEVFDKVTKHYAENRYNLEGWKTNSHYLLTKRFICPNITEVGWEGKVSANSYSGSNFEMLEDLTKALCYVTGKNYSDMVSLRDMIEYPYLLIKDGRYLNDPEYSFDVKYKSRTYQKDHYSDYMTEGLKKFPGSEVQYNKVEWGKWFNWGFFRVRVYKKGTAHLEFIDEDVWAMFNQRVAKLKGFPLPEQSGKKTSYQERNHAFKSKAPQSKKEVKKRKPVVLSSIKLRSAA